MTGKVTGKDHSDPGWSIFNPADIVSWNVDKRYLRDLAEAGVRVIPTRFADRVSEALLKETTADFGDALVVKPVVSAGAKNTLIWKDGDVLAFDAIEDKAGPIPSAAITAWRSRSPRWRSAPSPPGSRGLARYPPASGERAITPRPWSALSFAIPPSNASLVASE